MITFNGVFVEITLVLRMVDVIMGLKECDIVVEKMMIAMKTCYAEKITAQVKAHLLRRMEKIQWQKKVSGIE